MKPKDFINGPVTYDAHGGQYFWINKPGKDAGVQMLAELRGWGAIQHLDVSSPEAFQDEIGKFIADAINEKLEREKDVNT